MTLSPDLLGRLSGWATTAFGLRFPPDRWNELGRGIASAALELGIPDLAGWADNLVSGSLAPPEHLTAIANHLTISETYFFRHPDTFVLLERELLPARLKLRLEQRRPLKVWSAGCASGEEPYSIAILLRHRFGDALRGRPQIVGTDINSHVLERARRAVYSEWSFRDTPDWVRTMYFTRLPNGRSEVVPEIREMVRFVQLNFASPLYPAEFGERADYDLILCRNVLMYFSADWQNVIIRRLVQALSPGGWLLVGPVDIAGTQAPEYGLRVAGAGVFQKLDGARQDTDSPLFLRPLPAEPAFVASAPDATPAEPGRRQDADHPTFPPTETPTQPLVPGPVEIAADNADVASARAQALADRGELQSALVACDEAIALNKTNAGYHYLRGCILQEMNRPEEAEGAFRRVLFLEPNAIMAAFALACLLDRKGRRDEARHLFRRVLETLSHRNRGESVPGSAGLTVGRIKAVIENNLAGGAA